MVAAVSYLLFFITGIVILLVEKEDRFVRFHAMQSAVVFGLLFAATWILGFLLNSMDLLANLASILLWLVIIYVWVVSMIKSYRGEIFKWPIAGNFAEKNVK